MDFSFLNFDLLSVGVAVAGMAILGFVVLFSDSKNFSYKVFFLLAISSSIWGVLNYLSDQVDNSKYCDNSDRCDNSCWCEWYI
jgi:hypothetical protein